MTSEMKQNGQRPCFRELDLLQLAISVAGLLNEAIPFSRTQVLVNRLLVSHANTNDLDTFNPVAQLVARTDLALQMLRVDPFDLLALQMACTRVAAQALRHLAAVLLDLGMMIVDFAIVRVLVTVLERLLVWYIVR